MPWRVANSTSSRTSSSFWPFRSSWSRISPTRRMAHSFSTNAKLASSLFSTSVAGKSNDCRLLADHAFHHDFRRARLLVSADQHQLLAGEKVEHIFRIEAIHRRAFLGLHLVEDELQLHAGQHGRLDAVVELADEALDVLVRPDVLALAVVLADQLVQQPAVHIVAHAEAEQPGVDLVALLGSWPRSSFR